MQKYIHIDQEQRCCMKFAIIGATGFVGKKLVSELLRSEHSVRVLGRSAEKVARLFGNAVEFQAWNPASPHAPKEALQGVDAIIHLAGEGIADKRWSTSQKQRIHLSRVDGTRNIVSTLKIMGESGPKTLVCASAIGFYGDRHDEILTEASPPGNGFLSQVCIDWEKEAALTPPSIRTVSIRIGIVLGKEGGAVKKLLPIFATGMGGPVGNGRQWMSWIHVDDLVRLLVEAATNPKYRGKVNGVAPGPVTNAEFSNVLGKALHRPAFLPAPAFALKLLMGELSVLVLSSQRVLPKVAEENGFSFRFPMLEGALLDIVKKKETEIECFQWVPKSRNEVFPFFADERNLERITPPWLHFKVSRKTTAALAEGSLIDYRLKVHGVPLKWRSKIIEWKPGESFVDVQVKGPYRLWHHTHEFFPSGKGTLMRDRIRYQVPRIPLADLFINRFVSKDIERIFSYRRAKIEEIFGAE